MNNQNNLYHIIAELAPVTDLPEGPVGVLNRIKAWCMQSGSIATISGGNEFQINPNLTKTRYAISYGKKLINLSFLFHSLSNRWYLDKIEG